jgi:hypothetical protein
LNLDYAPKKKWPLSLNASLLILLAVVPAVTICWFVTNSLMGKYFMLPNEQEEMLANCAAIVCFSLDKFPPLLLMLVANAGAMLAFVNWRQGAVAKACALAHVAVFGVSAYTLVA